MIKGPRHPEGPPMRAFGASEWTKARRDTSYHGTSYHGVLFHAPEAWAQNCARMALNRVEGLPCWYPSGPRSAGLSWPIQGPARGIAGHHPRPAARGPGSLTQMEMIPNRSDRMGARGPAGRAGGRARGARATYSGPPVSPEFRE